MEQTQPPPSHLLTRRGFLQTLLAAIAAAWAGVLVQQRFFAPTKAETARPVEVPLAELPVGGVKEVAYGGSPVLVMRSNESVVAMSMICTHLGCRVQWQEAKQEFFCPCHQGKFDRHGEVVAGPPPLPLERLAVKVVGERVVVGEG